MLVHRICFATFLFASLQNVPRANMATAATPAAFARIMQIVTPRMALATVQRDSKEVTAVLVSIACPLLCTVFRIGAKRFHF